jgi:hypothetical protein
VTAKRVAVKSYVVKLREAERERLNTLIHAGKHPARQLTRARILLKADSPEAGDAWSDSQIATALDTSVDTVARTRQQLVEEGLDAPRNAKMEDLPRKFATEPHLRHLLDDWHHPIAGPYDDLRKTSAIVVDYRTPVTAGATDDRRK